MTPSDIAFFTSKRDRVDLAGEFRLGPRPKFPEQAIPRPDENSGDKRLSCRIGRKVVGLKRLFKGARGSIS
jgi:hypothetical protein